MPSQAAAAASPAPLTVSNDVSTTSVPARAVQLACGSSRRASSSRRRSPPREDKTPVTPAPHMCQAQTLRRREPGQSAWSTPCQASPRAA